jgi:hypothetical protein
MTAFIGWVDPNVGGTPIKVGKQGVVMGANMCGFVESWSKLATDANGSIYFITTINADALIHSLKLNQTAIANLTSLDIGLYNTDPALSTEGGPSQTAAAYYAGSPVSGTPSGANALVDAGAIFVSALDSHLGYAEGSEYDALSNLVIQTVTTLGAATNGFLNYSKKIWELLGFTDPKWAANKYTIGVRLNAAGANTGNFVLRGTYVEG